MKQPGIDDGNLPLVQTGHQLEHFRRISQLIVRINLHLDFAVRAFFNTFTKHLCGIIAGMIRIGIMA